MGPAVPKPRIRCKKDNIEGFAGDQMIFVGRYNYWTCESSHPMSLRRKVHGHGFSAAAAYNNWLRNWNYENVSEDLSGA